MSRKAKIGIFGCGRGRDHIQSLNVLDNAEVVAICDKNETLLYETKEKFCGENTKTFTDFDEFIKEDMDGIVLVNYFHEHTPFAIKAMERGIAVCSETTPASTMKECVELVRAVERTGGKYMFGENYPFMIANEEIKRIYESGTLGRVLYAQGEYCHTMSPGELKVKPESKHWRAWEPKSYYLTHSLGPLMYITGEMPVSVNCRTVFAPDIFEGSGRQCADAVSVMICKTESGAILQTTGHALLPPHGNWYRISCTKGGAEVVRGDEGKVRVGYNWWDRPENAKDGIYKAEWASNSASAEKTTHGGSDFWVMYNFVEYILNDVKPFFDVYRSVSISAVGILGWRSTLNNGMEFKIPDFKCEADRAQYENDDASPFPGSSNHCLPSASQPYVGVRT